MNEITKYIVLTIAGISGGLFLGTLGQSASIVIVPIITFFSLIEDYNKAIGTALFSILPMFIFNVYKYYSNNNIEIKKSIYLTIVSFIASYIGIKIKKILSIKKIKLGTAIMYLLLSIYWFHISLS